MIKETPKVVIDAISRYGEDAQLIQSVEELNELATALLHYRKQKAGSLDVAQEIADVLIMCYSMRFIIGESKVDDAIKFKLHRLKIRLKK